MIIVFKKKKNNGSCICQLYYDSKDNCQTQWKDEYPLWNQLMLCFSILCSVLYFVTCIYTLIHLLIKLKTDKKKLTVMNSISVLLIIGGTLRVIDSAIDPWGYRGIFTL